MMRRRNAIVVATVALVSLAAMAVAVSDVPRPDIPRGQGEHCVEDTDFMRRNHMTLLMHQRDETVLKGVRSKQHSLKGCISCHVVHGSDAKPVTASSPKHFCSSCHDYAAVKIDCFQCHASRPDAVAADASE